MTRAVLEVLEQLLRPGELDGARERGLVVRRLRGTLLDHSEHEAGTDAVEAPQAGVIRQEDDLRLRVQHPGGVEQRRDHERAARVR